MYNQQPFKKVIPKFWYENIHKFFYLFYFFYCQFIFLFYSLYCATKQSIDYEYYIAKKSIETNMNYVFVGLPVFFFCVQKLSRLYRPKDPKRKKKKFYPKK